MGNYGAQNPAAEIVREGQTDLRPRPQQRRDGMDGQSSVNQHIHPVQQENVPAQVPRANHTNHPWRDFRYVITLLVFSTGCLVQSFR